MSNPVESLLNRRAALAAQTLGQIRTLAYHYLSDGFTPEGAFRKVQEVIRKYDAETIALDRETKILYFYCPACQRTHDAQKETIPAECLQRGNV
jgi:hypothetical protein